MVFLNMINGIDSLIQENPVVAVVATAAAVSLTIYFSCYKQRAAHSEPELLPEKSLSDRMKALREADTYSRTGIKPTA